MTWKPKDLDEALEDAILCGINDNIDTDDSNQWLDSGNFDQATKEAIQNIKAIKGITITYKIKE